MAPELSNTRHPRCLQLLRQRHAYLLPEPNASNHQLLPIAETGNVWNDLNGISVS